MFTKSAAFYDAIYSFKDYKTEAEKLHKLIQRFKQVGDGNSLLNIACGTGAHDVYLTDCYSIEGLDLDENLLKIAAERLPGVPLHHADMRDFDLGKQFDVVVCLFSSIGYVKTPEALRDTLQAFAKHTKIGGLVMVEPWFKAEQIQPGRIGVQTAETPDMKIVRMSRIEVIERLSLLNFHYMVGTANGIEYFHEVHEMGLFSDEEYFNAFLTAGFDATYDPEGIDGRGLYIGRKAVRFPKRSGREKIQS